MGYAGPAGIADTAPTDLRGTAYGFFNLVSGLAILAASVLAGLLWDKLLDTRFMPVPFSACWRAPDWPGTPPDPGK